MTNMTCVHHRANVSRVLALPATFFYVCPNNNTSPGSVVSSVVSADPSAIPEPPGEAARAVASSIPCSTGGNLSQANPYYFPDDILFRHSFAVSAVYCLAYVTVFIIGLFGNSFVVAVVYRTPRMRNVTNYFIVNLALADILVLIFCLPATLLGNIFVPWVLGPVMCKTVPYVQGLSVAASVLSLIAVSIDRFLAICYPMKCQITTRRARVIIMFIWIVALLIPLPWAMYFDLLPISEEYPDLEMCFENWNDPDSEKLYFLIGNLGFFYLLPLLIISYCYVQIWFTVWTRNIPGETKHEQMDMMMAKSKIKVVKMLVVVVVVFMLSWLPLYTIITFMKFAGQGLEEGGAGEELISLMVPIAQWLGSSNSCINPILYAFFNNKFRRGFIAIVRSKQCCGTLRYDLKPKTSTFRSKSDFYSYRSSWRDTQMELLSTTTGV